MRPKVTSQATAVSAEECTRSTKLRSAIASMNHENEASRSSYPSLKPVHVALLDQTRQKEVDLTDLAPTATTKGDRVRALQNILSAEQPQKLSAEQPQVAGA